MFDRQTSEKDIAAFKKRLLAEGYSIYSDDFGKVVQEPATGVQRKKAVFIVTGGNTVDPTLFERGSEKEINELNSKGFDVNVLNIDEALHYAHPDQMSAGSAFPVLNAAQSVRNAFANIRELSRISIYSHAHMDINLTTLGADLSSKPIRGISRLAAYRVFISDLRIGYPAASGEKIVNIFACMGEGSLVGQLMADATGWKTRTVRPGYSCEFPSGAPRSQRAGAVRYDDKAWVWWDPKGTTSRPGSPPIFGGGQ